MRECKKKTIITKPSKKPNVFFKLDESAIVIWHDQNIAPSGLGALGKKGLNVFG